MKKYCWSFVTLQEMGSVYRAQIGLFDLPCSTKRICGINAAEKLRQVDWCCTTTSEKSYSVAATPTCLRKLDNLENKTSTEDDLASSMYKALRLTNDSYKTASSSSNGFCAWPVCSSAEQHMGSYLAGNLSFSERTQDLSSTISKKHHSVSEIETQAHTPVKTECFKEPRVSSSPLEMRLASATSGCSWVPFNSVSPQTQNSYRVVRVCNSDRQSDSPHNNYKFYHFNSASDHIRLYRESITNARVNNHIKKKILQTATTKSTKSTNETRKAQTKNGKHCKKIPSNFTFFRLNVSKAFNSNSTKKDAEGDQGILRVGPCPGVRKIQPVTSKKNKTKHGKTVLAKFDDTKKQKEHCTKFHNSQNTSRGGKKKVEFPQRLCEIVTPQTVLLRTRKPRVQQNKDAVQGEKKFSLVKQAEKGVRVQLVFFETQPSVEKSKRKFLHSKTKNYSRVNRSANSDSGREVYKRNGKDKPNIEDKEFLRITTPLGRSKTISASPLSEPAISGSTSPLPSSANSNKNHRATSSSRETRRSKLLSDLLSLQRQPQVVFPKKSSFQACITPTNNAKSTTGQKQKYKKDQAPSQELASNMDVQVSNHNVKQCVSKENIERMVSCPSIPRVGPFISG